MTNCKLFNAFLAFREYCISYWFQSLSKIEDNGLFSDYKYEFYFGNTTFVEIYFEFLSKLYC